MNAWNLISRQRLLGTICIYLVLTFFRLMLLCQFGSVIPATIFYSICDYIMRVLSFVRLIRGWAICACGFNNFGGPLLEKYNAPLIESAIVSTKNNICILSESFFLIASF